MMDSLAARASRSGEVGGAMVLAALPFPVMVVDADGSIGYVNGAVEQFFGQGATVMLGRRLDQLLPDDSPLISLVAQVRKSGASVAEYDVAVLAAGRNPRRVSVQAAPFGEDGGSVVVSFQERSFARDIDRRLIYRDAARSVTALASVLAHEVKNPLSGIRGAAQLLEQTASADDRQLTRLICEETDRICALVDSMSVFAENPLVDRTAVNIHEVLERVRRLAEAGFARNVRFVEEYDPSLPPVYGDRDQLIQVFLNLVKNAAEAVPARGGEIVLATAYRHGVRLALPGGERRVQLPLWISVADNGPGIAPDLLESMFDPFVTTKSKGSGLGLALVAKLIGDHGGAIECESEAGRTVFHVMLPMVDARADQAPEDDR